MRMQSWSPPQLHCQHGALLPKTLCDLSKCTGGWHQPNSRMSPPRLPWFVARVCQPSAFTQVVLSPRPRPAEKVYFHQRGWEGWWEENNGPRIMEGQCSSAPLLPRDSLRMVGHHHTTCWLGQAPFEVSQRWYSDKTGTDQHPLRLITPLYRHSPFWNSLFSTYGARQAAWHHHHHHCIKLSFPELRNYMFELIIHTYHRPCAQQQIHSSNSGVQSHSLPFPSVKQANNCL